MSALLDLAERCEKATGPDRELDGVVAVQIYPEDRALAHLFAGRMGRFAQWIDRIPRYTASLDAAMTLVPEGFAWSLSRDKPYGPEGRADAVLNKTVFAKNAVIAQAATPALALCAAALRARAAVSQEPAQ